METVKIILVDDHDILMDGIESILKGDPYCQVVGKASSAEIAEHLIQQLRPDLVLTDISLGEVSGLELTKRIKAQFPALQVMILTMHDSVQQISSLLEAGAKGYLLKSIKQDELFLAIRTVMADQQYIQQSLIESYTRARQQLQKAEKQSVLTPREIEIIRLIAKEHTTAEISRQLFLSEHTVETHRKNITRKTGAKTVIGLVNYAKEQGLL
ncbi:MAG TPA: response regulator transcription factor [Flavisolibacter sp.]|nr:response regulator transcription factor [Flavisolibacter sp.]